MECLWSEMGHLQLSADRPNPYGSLILNNVQSKLNDSTNWWQNSNKFIGYFGGYYFLSWFWAFCIILCLGPVRYSFQIMFEIKLYGCGLFNVCFLVNEKNRNVAMSTLTIHTTLSATIFLFCFHHSISFIPFYIYIFAYCNSAHLFFIQIFFANSVSQSQKILSTLSLSIYKFVYNGHNIMVPPLHALFNVFEK